MCETLILGWLHASQIPQLSDLDFFFRVALKGRRSMRRQFSWTREHCILTITLLARSTIQAGTTQRETLYNPHPEVVNKQGGLN